MRFKLDENFGTRTQQLFQARGYDVETIRNQGLQGCSDQHLYEVCCAEHRCLVTLDLDFSEVTRFPPSRTEVHQERRRLRGIAHIFSPSLTISEPL
jgi:predicted nuclease of predicted toxin-antitoxin system